MAAPKQTQNPAEWGGHQLGHVAQAVAAVVRALNGGADATRELPDVRALQIDDLWSAISKGFDDFKACRSDVLLLCVIYPVVGILLAQMVARSDMLQLIFPLMSGFALLGPAAATGLYEMSRLREQGEEPSWGHAFQVFRSPAFGAIFVMGLLLVSVFILWLIAANTIYYYTMGPEFPVGMSAFLGEVFSTPQGLALMLIGTGVGFVFAVVVLMISVVSFPMLLDRDVGVYRAVGTSVRAALKNPIPIAVWGFIVALALVAGSVPLLLGLVIVVPVLGHATWHLYRRVVVHD